jgi:hypothetical protein
LTVLLVIFHASGTRPFVNRTVQAFQIKLNMQTACLHWSSSRISKCVFFVLLGALLVTPLWMVRYPPLVDYPNHLARSFVLAHLNDPKFGFNQFYAADWGLYPYVLADVLASGLQRLIGIDLAGRAILSLCVLGLPLAILFFLRHANPEASYLAVWGPVIAYNPCFLTGFISSELSVSLCFLAVGLWLSYLYRPGLLKWCALLVLMTVLYLTHLIGFGVAGLIVTVYGLTARLSLREMLCSLALFVPGATMYLVWQLPLKNAVGFDYTTWDLHWKLAGLAFPLRGYSKSLDLFTLVAVIGCVVAVVWRNPSIRWNFRWLGVAAVVFAFYWVIPAKYGLGGGNVDVRIPQFLFIILLATMKPGGWKRVLIATAILLFAIRIGYVGYHFVQEETRLERLATSFSTIPAHARVMPLLRFSEEGPYARRGEVHLWAYGIIEKGWLSPALFHIKGIQPISLRNDIYCVKEGCGPLVDREPDWGRVSRDYDYVWAYDLPEYDSQLKAIGSCIFSESKIRVFHMENVSTSGSTGPGTLARSLDQASMQ